MRLWLDMDGVLADLRAGYRRATGLDASTELDSVDWELVRGVPGFFRRLPPMPDALDLWSAVAHLDPVILSGVPRSVPEAPRNKREWVDRVLGPRVPAVFCPSSEKWVHCLPGDVLVDDWEKYRRRWERAGGTWITHRNAAQTIAALKSLGIL